MSLTRDQIAHICSGIFLTDHETLEDYDQAIAQAVLGAAAAQSPAAAGEAELRRMLALAYSGMLLYGDDGELQDNTEYPFIDFKRDDPFAIAAAMAERSAAAAQKDPRELIEKQARNLIAGAELFGLEVRISTRPRYPLAMGNHDPVIEVSLLNRIYRKTT